MLLQKKEGDIGILRNVGMYARDLAKRGVLNVTLI